MATSPIEWSQYFGGAPPASGDPASPAYSYLPNYSTYNPSAAMRGNRNIALAWGSNIDQQLADMANYGAQLQRYYQPMMTAEAQNIAQTPGYTPDELSNITRLSDYQAGITTPEQFASLDPTAAEYAGMGGDPNSLYGWFDPATMQDINAQSAAMQRGQFGTAQSSLGNVLQQQQRGAQGAISGARSELSGSFLPSVEQAYGQHAAAITGAAGNPNLQLNLAPSSYLMSDQEKQAIINQAGQSVQDARQAQFQNIYNRALASGNADPMALAALQTQYQGQANEEAANAQTNAYLGATGQQRQLAMNLAQAQLGASQTQAGMQIGSQQNLLAQQLGEANAYQGMSLGLTQDQLAAIQAQTQAGLGAGEYLGSTGIGMEQGIGGQQAGTQQYITGMGTNIAGDVNTLNTQFQNQQYQNRLANAMYGQQTAFNQNTALQDRQAAAYQAAANARMQGQNTFLNWSTGQTGQALNQQQTAMQQRIGGFGTALGAANQATGQWGQYDMASRQLPSTFDKVMGGIAGGLSAFGGLGGMSGIRGMFGGGGGGSYYPGGGGGPIYGG